MSSGLTRTISSSSSPSNITFPSSSDTTAMSVYGMPSPSSSGPRGIPSTTTAELVMAEAHYLSTLKRVGNALNLTSKHSAATGRKNSNTVRALVERWATMMQIHSKFHDDIVAVKEDVRSATVLLNGLILTLEPVLVDHGRDLSSAVYKLGRNEKKSGHKPAEWDVALRHPFEHLIVYSEWLQRIDPPGKINQECLAQLNNLVLNVRSIIGSNHNPRGMLKRISTLARGVLRRQSSPSLLSGPLNHDVFTASPLNISAPSSINSSISPSTAFTISTEYSRYARPIEPSNVTRRASMDIPRTLSACAAASAASENRIETVTDQACSMADLKAVADGGDLEVSTLSVSSSDRTASRGASSSTLASSAASVADEASLPYRHPNRTSISYSETTYSETSSASVGSLTLAPSSESLHVKIITTTITAAATPPPPVITSTRPTIPGRYLSTSMSDRQKKFLRDMGGDSLMDSDSAYQSGGGAVVPVISRKATLRSGAQALITAKAESLQQQQLKFQQLKQKQQQQYEQYELYCKNQLQQVEVDGERKQSPGFVSRPSIDRLRTITQREVETKPPVKSLISFWEQAKEAIPV